MEKSLAGGVPVLLKSQLRPCFAPLFGAVLIPDLIIKGPQERSSNKQIQPSVRGRDEDICA